MTTAEKVQILSAITAVAAVVIGPGVALVVARWQVRTQTEIARKQLDAQILSAGEQIRAQTVVTNRQQWINALRSDIAKFVSDAYRTITAVDQTHEEQQRSLADLLFIHARLRLSLNPGEPDHQELMALLQTAQNRTIDALRFNGPVSDRPMIQPDLEGIITKSKLVLKREWEVIKTGR